MTRQQFSLASAFKAAWNGIVLTSRERNFRIEMCFALLATVLGFAFSISVVEWAIVIVCFGLVLGGEAINSSMEAVVDLVSPEFNELAGKAKDCAAGAVFLFSIASFVVGVIIYLPKILTALGWL